MRRNQIEVWKKESRRNEDECEEIILSPIRNAQRPRIPTVAERKRAEIERRRIEFCGFVQPRLFAPCVEMSKLLVNGKEAGIGFIAIDGKDRHKKIVRSYFFGPKGY